MGAVFFEQAITSIQTSQMRKRVFCEVRYSSYVVRFLKILRQHNFIYGFKVVDNLKIHVYLRYVNGKPAITKIEQVSKPSARYFATSGQLRKMISLDPTKVYIVTTSDGLRAGNQYWSSAAKLACGEVICKVW